MNCSKCQQLLVAYQEGLLERENEQVVAEHLRDCDVCKAELEALGGIRDRLVQEARASASGPLVAQVMVRIVREEERRSRRITMIRKYRSALSLAAGVLLIGAVAVLMFVSPERLPTFVQLVEASEAAAARMESLRFIGRDSERGKIQDYELFVKNPFSHRKQYPDGSYSVTGLNKMLLYDKTSNKCAVLEFDWRARLKEMGLDPDTAATSMFTKTSMLAVLKEDARGLKVPESDIRIEETILEGKAAYKVSVSLASETDIDSMELYCDKVSGLLMKMVANGKAGWMGGEVVELNPQLEDSLFSTEPPEGADVVTLDKLGWNSL